MWGLDDYSFLGYVFGSAQVINDPVSRPSSIVMADSPLSPTNLYNISISRLHHLKHGPFHEHSPQLFSIASSVPSWKKVNTGLMKMYQVEVLSKWVVVQHIPLGGILAWEALQPPTSRSASPAVPLPAGVTVHRQNSGWTPEKTSGADINSGQDTRTSVPWASVTSVSQTTNLLPSIGPSRRTARGTPHLTVGLLGSTAASTSMPPGLRSPFSTSQGGARYTVSHAAGRGNIPGAMGLRDVRVPGQHGIPDTSLTPRSEPSDNESQGTSASSEELL